MKWGRGKGRWCSEIREPNNKSLKEKMNKAVKLITDMTREIFLAPKEVLNLEIKRVYHMLSKIYERKSIPSYLTLRNINVRKREQKKFGLKISCHTSFQHQTSQDNEGLSPIT